MNSTLTAQIKCRSNGASAAAGADESAGHEALMPSTHRVDGRYCLCTSHSLSLRVRFFYLHALEGKGKAGGLLMF